MTVGYGMAVLSVAAALFLAHWPAFHLEAASVSLVLCAVMFSAWLGGIGPGLLATVLSALAFYHSFLSPRLLLSRKTQPSATIPYLRRISHICWLSECAQRRASFPRTRCSRAS
jgi:K+-sensing histidine kinase KdpD